MPLSGHPADDVVIRPIRAAELPSALVLSTVVGWNQTLADWQRMHAMEPNGCFVAEMGGRVVGTTVCCVFGSVAWLAMVIVSPDDRGQGIARRMVQQGLNYAQEHNVVTVRLDATALGAHVYRTFDFQPQFEFVRLSGIVASTEPQPLECGITIRPGTERDLDRILQIDQQATRTDRGKLLQRLCTESPPWIALSDDDTVLGYMGCRIGRTAMQLGPCCGSPIAAKVLLQHSLSAATGRSVIIDFPADRTDLIDIASVYGLTPQRPFLRMCRGNDLREDFRIFHISSGPEFG